MIRIVWIEDFELVRAGVCALMGAESDFDVIASAAGQSEALRIAASHACDVVVTGISLWGAGCASLVPALKERSPGQRVLVLSRYEESDAVAQALECGADGYALKSQPPCEVFDAIRTVAAGGRYLAPSLEEARASSPQALRSRLVGRLSAREREVYEMLVRGQSNQEAATELGISIKTVETHRMRVMRKLGAHNLADLIRIAVRQGLLGD
jgi:DNA-binding NarL/FixJ family response regulator